jgi:alpha-L-fucosidase
MLNNSTTVFRPRTTSFFAAAFLVALSGISMNARSDDKVSPRTEQIKWFHEAKFGLFVHYGLVSLSPFGKTQPMSKDVTQEEWQRRFTASKFDADAIADLAVEAGMKYITFTPYHGGGPYMFRSKVAHPNTVDDLPAKRDLVGEMAEACRKRGLGLMLYVHGSLAQSHAPVYERNKAIFKELLTQYGPIAGLWFDTDSAYYKDPERKLYPKLDETFALIRSLQPTCLISFCHGVTGDEDFITYEHRFYPQSTFKFVPDAVKKRLADKPVEICTTLQLNEKGGKGTKMWFNVEGAYHRTADEVWQLLGEARRDGCNLLLNVGPLGDGSLHPDDVKTLKEIGARLKKSGFPVAAGSGTASKEGEDR